MLPLHHLATRAGPDPWKGLAAGLAGGLVGSLAMAQVHALLTAARGDGPKPGLDDVAGDAAGGSFALGHEPSTVRGARVASRSLTGRDLPRGWEEAAGRAFHLAFGLALGGAYGVLVEYLPVASSGLGLPFGSLQTLFADEVSVPALGLSDSPAEAPAPAHLASLAGHATFGVAAELVRRRFRAWL